MGKSFKPFEILFQEYIFWVETLVNLSVQKFN